MRQLDGLTHDALFYDSDQEFVSTLVPFARAAVARGDAVLIAVTPRNTALLRDGLGDDADAVSFIDHDGWYGHPASTLVRWRELLAEATGNGREPVRVIGEVAFGAEERHPSWSRYESVVNEVLAELPAWIVCPYDTRTLTTPVLANARRTHPAVLDPVRRASDDYLPVADFLRAVPEPMPVVDGPPTVRLPLHDAPGPARHVLRDLAGRAGRRSCAELDGLLAAVTEIVVNGIRHGRGRRELAVWWTTDTVVCEVTDEGDGPADPLAGYRVPDHSVVGGRGLWMARQLCDALAIRAGDGTTRVRLSVTLPTAS